MRLAAEVTVGAPLERAWPALLDLGGALDVDLGGAYSGSARLDDADDDEHAAGFHLVGRECAGSGLASATLRARASADGDETRVAVDTELLLSGPSARPDRATVQEAVDRLLALAAAHVERALADPPAPADRSVAELARELLAEESAPSPAVEPPDALAGAGRVAERALLVVAGVALGLAIGTVLWRRR